MAQIPSEVTYAPDQAGASRWPRENPPSQLTDRGGGRAGPSHSGGKEQETLSGCSSRDGASVGVFFHGYAAMQSKSEPIQLVEATT